MFHLVHPLDLCCDNCIRKMNRANRFKSIYDLISFLDTSYGRDPISHPVDNDASDSGSTTSSKTWGNLRAGNRLIMRRRVLDSWRYDCWKRDYRLCSWGAVGVMPDPILSKLASSIKIETFDDLLEAASDWGYASKYGHEVLSLLKNTDREHRLESQAQRMKTRQLNKKRKLEDLERDEEQQILGGSPCSGSPAAPLTLVRTRMIHPIVVKHIERPTRPLPSRPQPRPVLFSRPYTRTDIFDSLMGGSRHM